MTQWMSASAMWRMKIMQMSHERYRDLFLLSSSICIGGILLTMPDMIASSGQSEQSGVLEDRLLHNYPNPFNPETWIPYSLRESSDVAIEIYTLDGRLVRNIQVGKRPAGDHITKDKAAYWDGHNDRGESVSSGVYFYTLKVNGRHVASKRLVLLK